MQTAYNYRSSLRAYNGFTIVELLITISVIGILAVMTAPVLLDSQKTARDTERTSDNQTIARYLEQIYTEKANATSSSYATYPSVASLSTDATQLLSGGFKEATIPPSRTSSNLLTASTTGDQSAIVTTTSYIYQPMKSDGTLCDTSSAASPCVKFILWYKFENKSPAVNTIYSRHQQ